MRIIQTKMQTNQIVTGLLALKLKRPTRATKRDVPAALHGLARDSRAALLNIIIWAVFSSIIHTIHLGGDGFMHLGGGGILKFRNF